jgi:ABC-type multidrug transport system ATPase subunit
VGNSDQEKIMSDMKKTLWHLENITRYGDKGFRLHDISLDITSGLTALLGPSGSGKTSLLNILVGFERPDTGRAEYPGRDTPFYWVPANHGLWPHLKVRQHLSVMTDNAEDNKIDEILAMFEILSKQDSYPPQLSEGECARLSVARALAGSPSAVVMDEPLINIAPAKQIFFWERLVEYASSKSMSLIYATHSPKYVVGSADNIICMKDSKIIYAGDVETLYFSPSDKETGEYLGPLNWFDESCRVFIPSDYKHPELPFGLRPEKVKLSLHRKSRFTVVKTLFRGDVTETEIADSESGTGMLLFHYSSEKYKQGDRVALFL